MALPIHFVFPDGTAAWVEWLQRSVPLVGDEIVVDDLPIARVERRLWHRMIPPPGWVPKPKYPARTHGPETARWVLEVELTEVELDDP